VRQNADGNKQSSVNWRRRSHCQFLNGTTPAIRKTCAGMKNISTRARSDSLSPLLAEATRLYESGNLVRAEQTIRMFLAGHPEHAEGLHILGLIAHASHHYEDAEAFLRRALSMRRGDPAICNNLGLALQAQGKYEDAIRLLRRAVSARPDNAVFHLNLGSALKDSDDIDLALTSLGRAIGLDPMLADAHFGRALCLLALGRIDEAWTEYEWRKTVARAADNSPTAVLVQRPSRMSPADLHGKRILILEDQGLGDALFFLRYGPKAKSLGAWLTYRGSPELSQLLSQLPWLDAIVDRSTPVPVHDVAFLAGDLPLVAGNSRDGLPAALAFIPNERIRDSVRARLALVGPPPYLGITWRAGKEAIVGMNRTLRKSVPLALFAQALSGWPGTAVVLQRAPSSEEIAAFARESGLPTADLSTCNDDLAMMLALLDIIDEYAGVSNTNMHLRAGLYKTARVLIPSPPEWRWTSNLQRSPWFPDFALYREDRKRGWERALRNLRSDVTG
jgi:tetratricopeptide (TPR) repeat protein